MRVLIAKFIITYMAIATFLLLNLLFNNNINFNWINKETGEIRKPPYWYYIYFSFYWIITFPLAVLNFKRSKDDDEP